MWPPQLNILAAMAFNSFTGNPSIPRDRSLILLNPLDMWLIQRKRLILHLFGTPIILHRMVDRQPRPQGAFPWLWGRGFSRPVPKAREKRPGDEVGRQAPCVTATPPHPFFESFVGKKNVAASAPPETQVYWKRLRNLRLFFPCFVVYNAKAYDKRGFLW